MAKIEGVKVITELSVDGTVWKQLVCETESGFQMSRETFTAPRTKCDGPASGQEVTLKGYSGSMSFDGAADDEPTTGQWSYDDIKSHFLSGTKLYARQQNDPTTPTYINQARVFVTELSAAHPEEGFVTFSGTLTATGDIS